VSRVDVLVIGGGLVGCATAFHLAGHGADVLLLEKDELNGKASGQNAGSLHFQLEHRLVEQSDALAEHFAVIIPLNSVAMEEWAGLEATLAAPLEVVMQGGLMVAETKDEVDKLEKKYRLERQAGLPITLIDGDAARRLAPALSGRVIAAAFCAREGHANPRLVTLAFAAAARRRGARLRTGTRLTAAERRPGGGFSVRLQGPDGRQETLVADKILNAGGAWAGQIGVLSDLHLPVFALGLTMNVTNRTAPLLGHLIQHIGRKLSMKQVADGNLLIGGGWPSRLVQPAAGAQGFDLGRRAELISSSVRRNLQIACEIVPQVRSLALLRSWTGIVTATPDELPLLGEIRACPGYYVATGGAGFTLGPTLGRLMSELILTGRTSQSIAPYSPDRFAHLNRTVH
jgi:glycine/D-amino acid oxidase-like deaminating enzyme